MPLSLVQISPGVPDILLETLLVEIAHFEPTPLLLSMEGVYPTISLGLPRAKDELFNSCLSRILSEAEARAASRAEAAKRALISPSPPPGRTSGATSPSRMLAGSRPTSSASFKAPPAPAAIPSPAGRKPTTAAASVPPAERKPDSEAERIRLVQLLVQREAAATPAAALAITAADFDDDLAALLQTLNRGRTPVVAEEGGNDLALPLDQIPALTAAVSVAVESPATSKPAPAVKRAKGAIQPPIPAIYSSNYVVDFGHVTKGTTRTRKFKMTNPSSQAVTLRFDKALLEAWGFKIDPEAVSKLPENGELEVTLTLQGNKPGVLAGPLELVMPLDVKGGPPVLLTLRANIQVSETT